MVERRIKMPLPGGGFADGVEVPIEESTERWTEFKLEDGTVMRVKTVVSAVMRLDNQYDQEGNPVYAVKSTPALTVVTVAEKLRRKVN